MLMVHQQQINVYKVLLFTETDYKQIRPQILDNIVEDLYVLENVLTKEDTLIVIIEDEPNDTIVEHMSIYITATKYSWLYTT
jgi:hypothetical protein